MFGGYLFCACTLACAFATALYELGFVACGPCGVRPGRAAAGADPGAAGARGVLGQVGPTPDLPMAEFEMPRWRDDGLLFG